MVQWVIHDSLGVHYKNYNNLQVQNTISIFFIFGFLTYHHGF